MNIYSALLDSDDEEVKAPAKSQAKGSKPAATAATKPAAKEAPKGNLLLYILLNIYLVII